MKTFSKTYLIKTPKEKVWEALVDPKVIDKWGAGPAKMKAESGTDFSMWGGEIWGKNLDVVPEKRLVQEWHTKDSEGVTKVTISLDETDGETKVSLVHENIEGESAYKDFAEGWDEYFFGPMKELLEKTEK